MIRDWLKRQPEFIALAVAAAVFVVGVVAFAGRDSSSPNPKKSPSGTEPRVGPASGDSIPSYIEKRKSHLQSLSAHAEQTNWAVVSFAEYRKPKDVDEFLESQHLNAAAVQWRVPKPEFKPAEVVVTSTIQAALAPEIRKAVESLNRDLTGFEGMSSSTSDTAAKAVFDEDAARVREAIAFLEKDPAVVFALITKAKNSALLKLTGAQGVRLVDVADDPAATPSTHNYAGIPPDVLDKAP
jgi:hypothetical protein